MYQRRSILTRHPSTIRRLLYDLVAKHPVTKPNIDVIRRSEENLNEKIDELMKQAIETVEVIEVK